MAVTREHVQHIAGLARVAVDESAVAALTDQLNGILRHFEALSDVNTEGVDPVAGVGDGALRLRADAGDQYPLEASRESFAPSMRDGFFLVPRLATHEDPAGEDQIEASA